MQNTIVKEFLGNPHVEAQPFDQGGAQGETREWLETVWSNYFLRGALIFDETGAIGSAYSQPDLGISFGRGFIIDRKGKVALPYFGHSPQMVIAEIWRLLGAGAVPDGHHVDGEPLTLAKQGDAIRLTWGASCLADDTDYEIYEGTIGNYDSHGALQCSTGGMTSVTLTPAVGENQYYLVVPTNGLYEGSYGMDGEGTQRPQGSPICREMSVTSCD